MGLFETGPTGGCLLMIVFSRCHLLLQGNGFYSDAYRRMSDATFRYGFAVRVGSLVLMST